MGETSTSMHGRSSNEGSRPGILENGPSGCNPGVGSCRSELIGSTKDNGFCLLGVRIGVISVDEPERLACFGSDKLKEKSFMMVA
jgi:hypothetical protein